MSRPLSEDIKEEMFKELNEYDVEPTNQACLAWLLGLQEVWGKIPAYGPDVELAKILYGGALSSLIFQYEMNVLFGGLDG